MVSYGRAGFALLVEKKNILCGEMRERERALLVTNTGSTSTMCFHDEFTLVYFLYFKQGLGFDKIIIIINKGLGL